MSLTFYEAEELGRLHREEMLREAEHADLVRELRAAKGKRPLISTIVFEKLAGLLMALGSRNPPESAEASPSSLRQAPISAATNPAR